MNPHRPASRRPLTLLVVLLVLPILVAAHVSVAAQGGKKDKEPGPRERYPIKPYCSVCLKKKMIEGPERKLRLMEFEGDKVLEHVQSKRLVYIETEYFKLVSSIPGYRPGPKTSKRLMEEMPLLKKRFPKLKGKYPKLNSHHVAHLLALHMHRNKLDFWEMFGTNASSYTGYMHQNNKHEIYLFGKQKEYDAFTDRFTGVRAEAGQEIVLRSDRAIGFVRPPPPRPSLNTWNNTVTHMWSHLLFESHIRNGYNMPCWLDAGLAHWFERRESDGFNTYCYSESKQVGMFGNSKWRPKVRKMVTTGKAVPFADFADIKQISSMTDDHHGLAFSIVDYMLQHKRKELQQFTRLLQSMDRVRHAAVFKQAFGRGVSLIDEEWREWVKKTYPRR